MNLVDTIVVHSFVVDDDHHHHSSTPLLDIGRDIVHSAVEQNAWFTVRECQDTDRFRISQGRSYYYAVSLPAINRGTHEPIVYPEWGHPPHADELEFSLCDLEEFENSNLDDIFIPRVSQKALRRPRPPISEASCSDNKRRKLDTSAPLGIIPQPHYHPARLLTHTSTPSDRIQPFRKTVPQPLNSYTSVTVREYLKTAYAQSAWIVPVRGVLPWSGCSSAIVLASEISHPLQPTAHNREITWTSSSLRSFWSFLLAVRDANTLGPLALAYHNSSRGAALDSKTSSPLEVDHIKIYHDAPCAMLIRNVLDAWAFTIGATHLDDNAGDPDTTQPRSQKIRVLKGAKLILLDDRSSAMLIS